MSSFPIFLFFAQRNADTNTGCWLSKEMTFVRRTNKHTLRANLFHVYTLLVCKADKNPSCEAWAARGECEKNPTWMLPNCCVSCKYHRAPKGKCVLSIHLTTTKLNFLLNSMLFFASFQNHISAVLNFIVVKSHLLL